MRIIIATHSELSYGYKKTIQFFFPDSNNIDYICAYIDDEKLEDQFENLISKHPDEEFYVLTDIKGGSVTQVAVNYMSNKFKIVAGLNLPLVFQLLTTTGDINDDHLSTIIETSREEIVYINEILTGKEENDD